ncbi:MAG TPA: DUF5652 family protein [Syntrophomonadaceae bacterium]|jgi:hypothetical protein|nr:DUF5652 family protein [Syntrophomonadaceae bacterium]HRX21237.1 DUF5652 family protein [Syntrophomonadaceae bacterium]
MDSYLGNSLTNMDPWIFGLLVVWSIIWKGWALWRAARLKYTGWYIALLIINTVGIFEIVFLLVTNKKYSEMGSGIR